MTNQIPDEAFVLAKDRWIIVGESADNSLIIRGGPKPFSMRVNCADATELHELVACANVGRRSRLRGIAPNIEEIEKMRAEDAAE